MREIRLYGSEGGGAARSPYPYRCVLLGRPTPAASATAVAPAATPPLEGIFGGATQQVSSVQRWDKLGGISIQFS